MVGARWPPGLGTIPPPLSTDGDGVKVTWHKARLPALLRLTMGKRGLKAKGVAGLGLRTHPARSHARTNSPTRRVPMARPTQRYSRCIAKDVPPKAPHTSWPSCA